tara:strand:+ start:782 stop:1096 length:315 start_codon:yes stop_codon:yes gene_type:complete
VVGGAIFVGRISMKIKRELKFATFEYDDESKSIVIVTRNREPINTRDLMEHPPSIEDEEGEIVYPVNGRIDLDSVNTFALLRFMIRIAQRNWFRKWLRPENSES